ERCIKEAEELDLREGVLDKFLYQNAERLFFSSSTQDEETVRQESRQP
ncbi:MAG: hypothetical protein IIB19_05115, partial [Chloroflexi bacterium]|nr:hypothetical protein [Chloroflexota bacterium]